MSDSLRTALQRLVDLKDGPRDERYYNERLHAWKGAREVLASKQQPTLPICPNCEGEHFTCGACGIVLDATVTPQPVVDREALIEAISSQLPEEVWDDQVAADAADAILALLTGSAK